MAGTEESLEKTIERCTQELSIDPSSRSFVTLAESYRKLGQYEEAIQHLIQGLASRPTYVPGKMLLAQCHFENGSAEEARVLLEEVLRVSPDNLLAMKLLATVLYEQGNAEMAGPLLERVSLMDPLDKIAVEQRRRLQDLALPKGVPATSTLAEMYKKQGHVQEAMDIYRTLLKQEPTQVEYISAVKELEEAATVPRVEGSVPAYLQALLSQIKERRRNI